LKCKLGNVEALHKSFMTE